MTGPSAVSGPGPWRTTSDVTPGITSDVTCDGGGPKRPRTKSEIARRSRKRSRAVAEKPLFTARMLIETKAITQRMKAG